MLIDPMDDAGGIERSREHRRGVRQACLDLEETLARPPDQDLEKWTADTAARFRQLTEAFQHHAEQSEGPNGLLVEIVEIAPRLANKVDQVKREHEVLLAELARLEGEAGNQADLNPSGAIRAEGLRLLQDLAAHRQRGADLIYEAYSVDVEGGDSG
jgi:hypothetical protein